MVDKVTTGVSPAKVTAVAMLVEVDEVEAEDSDSEGEEDYEEAQEGRVGDKWQEGEGFSSGSMGLTKFEAEKKCLIKRTIYSDLINCTLKDLWCMHNCSCACIPCTHPVFRCMCCPKHGCEKIMSMRYFIKFENVLIVTSV